MLAPSNKKSRIFYVTRILIATVTTANQSLNALLSQPTAENELKACFCETYCIIILSISLGLVNHLSFSSFQLVILCTFVVSNFHTTLSVYFKFHNFITLKIYTAHLGGSAAG